MKQNRSLVLRSALIANAIFSATCGALAVTSPDAIGALLGPSTPLLYRGIGVGLLVFAALLTFVVRRRPIDASRVLLASGADLGWVLGTLVLLAVAGELLSPAGTLALTAVAVIVLGFALAQLAGVERAYASAHGDDHGYYLEVVVPSQARPDQIWPVIRDLGGIQQYSNRLASSHIRGSEPVGPGAVRECSDPSGNVWAEKCTRLDDTRHEVDLRFLHEEPDFPFPVDRLEGGWKIDESAQGSVVTIWWTAHMSRRWLASLLLPLMHRSLRASMTRLVGHMSAAAQRGDTNEAMGWERAGSVATK